MKVISNIIVFILALLLFGCKTTSISTIESSLPAEVVEIGEERFVCKFYDFDEQQGWVKKYILEDQSVDDWQKLVGIRYIKIVESPKEFIKAMATQYSQKYPNMKFAVHGSDETNQWIIDFIMYTKADKGFVEWDYFQAKKADDEPGIIVSQYAIREPFSGSVDPAYKKLNLKEQRPKFLEILMDSGFKIKSVKKSE